MVPHASCIYLRPLKYNTGCGNVHERRGPLRCVGVGTAAGRLRKEERERKQLAAAASEGTGTTVDDETRAVSKSEGLTNGLGGNGQGT